MGFRDSSLVSSSISRLLARELRLKLSDVRAPGRGKQLNNLREFIGDDERRDLIVSERMHKPDRINHNRRTGKTCLGALCCPDIELHAHA